MKFKVGDIITGNGKGSEALALFYRITNHNALLEVTKLRKAVKGSFVPDIEVKVIAHRLNHLFKESCNQTYSIVSKYFTKIEN